MGILKNMRLRLALILASLVTAGPMSLGLAAQAPKPPAATAPAPAAALAHIVVIFQENVSFDHYFATYPHAANPPGEPAFHPRPGTPRVDGLSGRLLTGNPNAHNPANGVFAGNPFRLDRAQANTPDQNHAYLAEQRAFDHGAMDLFPRYTGRPQPPPLLTAALSHGPRRSPTLGYFDGNTVTALWNYAQRYAMSDHFFGTTFGPSTVGALNLVSGQTNGVIHVENGSGGVIAGGHGSFTDIGDDDPRGDVCSRTTGTEFSMSGPNVGDLLNARHVSWGWFQGGFDLSLTNSNGTTGCARSTGSTITGRRVRDYVPHHEPFQYYASTANLRHRRPTSVAMIGKAGDAANHQYDLRDFFAAVRAGNFPAVSFLKAPAVQNGHPGNSDPLDEQRFLVQVINFLQQQPAWAHTAVIVTYDDSDGWYDHVPPPIVNPSHTPDDAYSAPGRCGDGPPVLAGVNGQPAQGRCGHGPRLPLLVISPWARPNFVGHTVTDQTSVLRLIEDTFLGGQRLGHGSYDRLAGSLDPLFDFQKAQPGNAGRLRLDPGTGEPLPPGD